MREGNIWIDANDIKGVKNSDSRKVSLDSDIPQTYNAIRVKIRDRNCNHVYISAPKNLSMVPEQLAQLSPNPATEMVQFTLMDGMAEQVSVEVISPTGQKVYELNKQEIDGTFNSYIDVSQWAVGCYYLRVVTNNGSSIEKLVVQ